MINRYAPVLLCLLFGLLFSATSYAQNCLSLPALTQLDQQYEDALANGDAAFLANLLAEDFVWVHNLASSIETKKDLIARIKANKENFKDRRSNVLSAHQLDNTSVLSGTSLAERFNDNGVSSSASRYQFMRTYVAREDKCYLLAVQTMKVWSSDNHQEAKP